MELAEAILDRIGPILKLHGFKVRSKSAKHLDVASHNACLWFGYDPRERSVSMEGGRPWGGPLFKFGKAVDDHLMDPKHVALYKKTVDTHEDYADNLLVFFTHGAERFLTGDDMLMKELYAIDEKRHDDYSNALYLRQDIRRVDKAWAAKDYRAFLEEIKLIDPERIPKSYLLKVKIAKRELGLPPD
jgi:hypothetical protein